MSQGRAVHTPVGPGIVLSSRTSKDIGLVYEVALDEWRLCDRNPARAYIPSSQIVYEQSRRKALEAFRSSKPEPAPTVLRTPTGWRCRRFVGGTDSAGSLGEAAGRARKSACLCSSVVHWYPGGVDGGDEAGL